MYFDSGEGYFTVFKHTCRRENASSGSSGDTVAEQPFVLGIDADELYKGESLEETVLVQGIIDVWFEEDGELVVLDYKTDRVFKEEILGEKYSYTA